MVVEFVYLIAVLVCVLLGVDIACQVQEMIYRYMDRRSGKGGRKNG